ncbi:flap endonuclease 1 [Rhizophagus irregularis]|uniref:Flap endonuclease 1 n=2 Tax=Rhizophagus irregularis TaxID=588596 RepID=A0A2I1DZ11_9GLOM|nr:Rad27p [Rhizophagus irregularis DAOM 197198w]PKC72419.1 flap endonuclease 1 [Rhizophagus irregularis]PKY15110.1 flap endonuclease 1 [Rhizophagus irregularis]
MGIKGLTKVIGDRCPNAIKSNEIKNYFGRKVAIDASMSIYQFLIAVRQQDGQQLTTESGETTSHLMGIFYRTIRMVENGIKPCYVFDGKPPKLKSGELAKRLERRKEASKSLEEAEELGETVDIDKFSRRTVKVTSEHNDECKKLLSLMGIPYVEAPCEAEAQCAALARDKKVYAAASEDMDTLTFSTPVLLRHLTFSEARKLPIGEIHLNKVLEGLNFTMEQFVDLCILLGCDYCDSIKGIGPQRAVELIDKHKSLEEIIRTLDPKKYPIPDDWMYNEARQLFLNPEVLDPKDIDIKWKDPDVEEIVKYLVHEKGFSEDRVRKGVDKLAKHLKTATQGRLDSFFTTLPSSPKAPSKPSKRKGEDEKSNSKSKKPKSTSKRGRPKK